MVIAFFVFMESVARLVDPPDIDTNMLTVSFIVTYESCFAVNCLLILFLKKKKQEERKERLKLLAQEIWTVSWLFNG